MTETRALMDARWLLEKPLRVYMMRALIETGFVGPGRDFQTVVTAIVMNEKMDRTFIDHDSLAANLATAKKRGLLKSKTRRNGKTFFVQGRQGEATSNYWSITHDGIRAYRLTEGADAVAGIPDGVRPSREAQEQG